MAAAVFAAPSSAAPGQLDPTFGLDGVATTQFGTTSNSATSVALQPDGRIVVAGTSDDGHFALARFNADGSLDASFGVGGKAVIDVGGYFETAACVAVEPDGRIVAAGSTDPGGYCCQSAMVRLNADGTLDATFGSGGRVLTAVSGITAAAAIVLQPDGKIVLAGSVYDPFTHVGMLLRYNADGSLDASFGAGGKVFTSFGGYDAFTGLVMQGDGKLVAGGVGGPATTFVLARYNPDGSLDPSFGAGGKVVTDFASYSRLEHLAIQPDQKIVACGTVENRYGLARFNPNGTLDAAFGLGGKATTVMTGQNLESATGVAVQPDGAIVTSGWAFDNYRQEFALARWRADGTLDPGFGTGGVVTSLFTGHVEDVAEAMALQPDGRIVVAGGYGGCTPKCGFVVARYLGGPSNQPPDCSAAAASVPSLWPPDHRFVPISILGVTDPDGDPVTIRATGVTQDERTPGCADALIDANGNVAVRATRSGDGNGRVYVIHFVAGDDHGGTCSGTVEVCVPHDMGPASCADDGQQYNSLGPCPGGRGSEGPLSGPVPAGSAAAAGVSAAAGGGAGPSEAGAAVADAALSLDVPGHTAAGGSAVVRYSVPHASEVAISAYDVAGRRVATLDGGTRSAGVHQVNWDTSGLRRGIYFVRMRAGTEVLSRSVLVLK